MELNLTCHVCYDYEDFAEAGMEEIAYYDKNNKVVIVREFEDDDIYNLWFSLCEGWDGEIFLDEVIR